MVTLQFSYRTWHCWGLPHSFLKLLLQLHFHVTNLSNNSFSIFLTSPGIYAGPHSLLILHTPPLGALHLLLYDEGQIYFWSLDSPEPHVQIDGRVLKISILKTDLILFFCHPNFYFSSYFLPISLSSPPSIQSPRLEIGNHQRCLPFPHPPLASYFQV